ncbi:hypothetical protein BGZ63DRAFT_351909 [Mariannaea sp. PMI_226]|nr:hypothetical protein BGZ63DRAFT_351909 [Mariannaea sp. PMI_226]
MADFPHGIAGFTARDSLSSNLSLVKDWPPGANASDTVLANHHFNLTALKYWNYTYYSNETISNGSKCYLVFPPYQPVYLWSNGTFVNNTSCYSAIDSIRNRGRIGIGFAVAYGICLVLLLVALGKHGKIHLEREKRFYPIGRRWQWYWGFVVCACALIGLFMNIEIDRYYLQELPITVTIFFWYLMCLSTVALTWEAVRHWGSWIERQFIDPNPFVYKQNDRRAMLEFWLPLWFYFWFWLNFFLVVPRNWSFPQKQHSPQQTMAIAMPTATSGRFKASAFCLAVAWLTIIFSLRHSIKHYRDHDRGFLNRVVGFSKAVPLRFYLIIPLSAILIAYQAFIAWEWKYSLVRVGAPIYVIFAWGYAPSLLILIVQIVHGYMSPNEDLELIRQRHERGNAIDRELGIVQKPAWWRRVKGDHLVTYRDMITSNVKEIGGGKPTTRRAGASYEKYHSNPRMDRAGVSVIHCESRYPANPYYGKSDRRRQERIMETTAGILFPNELEAARAEHARRREEISQDGPPPPPYVSNSRRQSNAQTTNSDCSNSMDTLGNVISQPQKIRSMLDV